MTTATAKPSPWSFISTADVTLVSAMIEPTDRSMPPEMTTIAWATAANAIGQGADRQVLDLGRTVARPISRVNTRKPIEQGEQAERPAVAPGPVADRLGQARARVGHDVDGGAHAWIAVGAVGGSTPDGAASSVAAQVFGHRRIGREVVGGPQERRLVGILDRDLGDHPAAEDDDRPVAGELDLLELRGVQQDGGARRRQVAQQLVDLPLRADVDAAGRVEAQHRLDAAGDPARDGHLLLVAARQPPDLGLGARVDLERARSPRRPASVPRPCRSAPTREAAR